jgi:serine/threonine protein kinase
MFLPWALCFWLFNLKPLMSLKKLGRYDLIRVLGKGAMGLVYEGRDPNLDRRVAIKTIKVENLSDEAAAEYEVRFRTEARSAARLQHPNIVSVYDSDRDGDIAFLVMEFVEGDDLKHHLDKGEVYTLQQTLSVMTDLLSALNYAHQQKIVHRDIKPANLLVQASGSIKLADFGVARIQNSGDATRTQGSIVGTLKYMSPEQLEGRPIDARADLFAAGVVLYQLLTSQRPFDGDTDLFNTVYNIKHDHHGHQCAGCCFAVAYRLVKENVDAGASRGAGGGSFCAVVYRV